MIGKLYSGIGFDFYYQNTNTNHLFLLAMIDAGTWESVIIHEVGHILGKSRRYLCVYMMRTTSAKACRKWDI